MYVAFATGGLQTQRSTVATVRSFQRRGVKREIKRGRCGGEEKKKEEERKKKRNGQKKRKKKEKKERKNKLSIFRNCNL
jgi:hypothetical protein